MAINERNYTGFALNTTTGKPHQIRHLPKMVEWENGIYMYEAGDKFVADIDGIDNLPAQQLANRTEFLYEQNRIFGEACRGLLSIVKEISTGKIKANAYSTALSRDRPNQLCAWVEPQENLPSVAKTSPLIETENGVTFANPIAEIGVGEGVFCYVGGDGEYFPQVLKIIGTVDLVVTSTNVITGSAWIQPLEDWRQISTPTYEEVWEDGTRLDNPTAMIVDEEGAVYYVKAYATDKEPLYDETVDISGYDIATHGDIDAMLAR